MRRILVLFLGLFLTVGAIGCKKEDTPKTDSNTAAPGGDSDKDGDANATDDEPANPAEK